MVAANLHVAVLFLGCIPLPKSEDKIKTQAGFFAFDKIYFIIYKILPTNLVACQAFYSFYTSHLRYTVPWGVVFTDLGQILLFFAVFFFFFFCRIQTTPDLLARICKVNLSNAKKLGQICFPRICFRGLIYWDLECDRRCLLFCGCVYKAINSM